MNCEEMRAKLDAYIDGELSQDALRAFEEHAAACVDCKRELELAKLVRDALGEMPEEAAVPLSAQASWRRAVRAEAKRRKNRRWMRAAYGIAAALVLMIGATAMLRNAPAQDQLQMERRIAAEPTDAVVARDGDLETVALAVEEGDYAAWKKYQTEDISAACASTEALIQEYSGGYTLHMYEEEGRTGANYAIYRIELPREYLADFLNAVSHIGAEQDSETMDTQGETALVYIQINEAYAE